MILTGLLLFLPHQVLAYFGTDEIAKRYRGWIGIACVLFLLLLLTLPVETSYKAWQEKRNLRRHLRNISKGEFEVLHRALLNDGRGINVIATLGAARSLEKKGILWQSAARDGDSTLFNITDAANSVLKESEFRPLSDPENVGE